MPTTIHPIKERKDDDCCCGPFHSLTPATTGGSAYLGAASPPFVASSAGPLRRPLRCTDPAAKRNRNSDQWYLVRHVGDQFAGIKFPAHLHFLCRPCTHQSKPLHDALNRSPALERRAHAQPLRRNYFAQQQVSDGTVAAACAWLLPRHRDHYPGIRRGLFQVLNGCVKATAIDKWRYGLTPGPLWALRRLAELVGERARKGLEIEARLLAEIAEREARPRKPRGLEIIDEATGLPKYRNRVSRAHQSEELIEASARRRGEREI